MLVASRRFKVEMEMPVGEDPGECIRDFRLPAGIYMRLGTDWPLRGAGQALLGLVLEV